MTTNPLTRLLAPLREPAYRWLWASMAVSYVGDRLQELAQGWLVANPHIVGGRRRGDRHRGRHPIAAMPAFGLLAAIVHREGGSLVQLGLLAAARSVGSMLGAIYAGATRSQQTTRTRYLVFGLVAAASLALFAALPFGYALAAPSAVIGFVLFAEAVWNTSRVRQVAAPEFQARLQALTTMTFTLGGMVGLLWGGPAIDGWGTSALGVAAAVLAAATAALAFVPRQG